MSIFSIKFSQWLVQKYLKGSEQQKNEVKDWLESLLLLPTEAAALKWCTWIWRWGVERTLPSSTSSNIALCSTETLCYTSVLRNFGHSTAINPWNILLVAEKTSLELRCNNAIYFSYSMIHWIIQIYLMYYLKNIISIVYNYGPE